MENRLVIVHNILTPYRVHLFAALAQELEKRNITLEVWHMAETEPGRYWTIDPSSLAFTNRIARGWHFTIRGLPLHFNPSIIRHVLRHPPRWLWLGGAWYLPTTLLLWLLVPVVSPRTGILYWAEANYSFGSYSKGLVATLRRLVLRRADALVIPGQIARQTIQEHWGIADRPFVLLPNIVDERIYGQKVLWARQRRIELRSEYHLTERDFVILFPARLHEYTKGNLNFLQAVAPLRSSRLRILFAGEGPDRPKIEQWLAKTGMPGVFLLGHHETTQMVNLLALADLLALPSFRDPNPLSIIEGLWASLPILTSIYSGNWPETVEPGRNGWLVDPRQPQEVRRAVAEALDMSGETLERYGQRSREIAEERFQTGPAVQRFVDQLLSFE